MKTHVPAKNDTARRAQEVRDALRKAASAKGHEVNSGSAMIVHGERINWSVYEPSCRRQAPLTKKELASPYCSLTDRERGWKFILEPGGLLALVIEADFGSKTRIVETRKRPLENRIDEIIDRLELTAFGVAKRRRENEEYHRRALERQKRREERERLQRIEDRKWDDLNEFADDWVKAQHLRRFIGAVAERNEVAPDPSGRVQEWLAWVRPNVDAFDPLGEGIEGFLERLHPPEVSEYEENFGEPEDVDEEA